MKENFVITGSITYAMRGRELLKNHGYKANIKKTHSEQSFGCGYGVITNCSKEKIEELFTQNGIKFFAIY